jgi:hypothetical protein
MREFLDRTVNPVDMQILGIEGRTVGLKRYAELLQIPLDKMFGQKTDNALQQQGAMLASQQMGAEAEKGAMGAAMGGENAAGTAPAGDMTQASGQAPLPAAGGMR